MYQVIACGVNQTDGNTTLSYAEKDAKEFAALMQSDLGPRGPKAIKLLQGTSASSTDLMAAFVEAADANVDQLVFYFSGHANDTEFALSDGGFPYADLAYLIKAVRATHTFVILDVCSAASAATFFKEARVGGTSGLRESWLAALARATPGTRLVFSTGPGGSSRESSTLKHGVFTHYLLAALREAYGNLVEGDTTYVSDWDACDHAARKMKADGALQAPVCLYLTGDFPMTVSQAVEPIGWATFGRIDIARHSLDVRCKAFLRDGVNTHLEWSIFNAAGTLVDTGKVSGRSSQPVQGFYTTIPFPHEKFRKDRLSRLRLMADDQTPITWLLTLVDDAGNILVSTEVQATWRAASS